MTTVYTPENVFYLTTSSWNINEFIIALNQADNSTNWYRDEHGTTAFHKAANYNRIHIVELLLVK